MRERNLGSLRCALLSASLKRSSKNDTSRPKPVSSRWVVENGRPCLSNSIMVAFGYATGLVLHGYRATIKYQFIAARPPRSNPAAGVLFVSGNLKAQQGFVALVEVEPNEPRRDTNHRNNFPADPVIDRATGDFLLLGEIALGADSDWPSRRGQYLVNHAAASRMASPHREVSDFPGIIFTKLPS